MHLFAEKGYENTSTKLIAARANVSEALIFKHFENKDKLLAYLIKSGYRRVVAQNKGMISYQTPKRFLSDMIDLPHKLVREEPEFWKLQERLSHMEFSKIQHENFMKPVHPIILRAFHELSYADPVLETQLLLIVIDTLWKKEVTGELNNFEALITIIKRKYDLNPNT